MSCLRLRYLFLRLQTSECDIPGSPPGSGSCFYNPAVWERIWAKEKAAGSSRLTPSISFEEIEFALEATSLPSFIADFKLMAANMKTDVPGQGLFCAWQLAMRAITGQPQQSKSWPQCSGVALGSSCSRVVTGQLLLTPGGWHVHYIAEEALPFSHAFVSKRATHWSIIAQLWCLMIHTVCQMVRRLT